MIDVGGTILQMSVSALTVAVKAHQEGVVQQQIKTMGLRQWLSLVVAWFVNWIYTKTSRTYLKIADRSRSAINVE
jgi:hypothetical protein